MIEDPGQSMEGATGNIDGIDAGALMQQIESGGQITEQTGVQPAAQTQTTQPTTQPTQNPTAWDKDTITVNGQQFTASRDQILKWAAQGRDYPQAMQRLNSEKAQLEAKYKPYAEIDAYATKNPEWWSSVVQSYEQRGQNQNPATPAVPPEVLSEIDQLKQFKSSFEAEQANKALDAEVQDIRKSYPDLSWDVLDENGSSLEMRVYDHAVKNGIQSFKTAFRDLMHDHLIKYNADKAREAAVKELQAQRKQGHVGVSTTSTQAPPSAPRKFSSYDDAATAALAEYGIQAG